PCPPPRPQGACAAPALRTPLPEGPHRPGNEPESGRADPRRAAGGVFPTRPTDPPVPGEAPRGLPEDAGPDLLQAGGPVARRVAQTEHGIRPSVLRGPRGGRSPRDRDRRGPVG